MAPSVFRHSPFTQDSAQRSPRSVSSHVRRWSHSADAYHQLPNQDGIPLKQQINITTYGDDAKFDAQPGHTKGDRSSYHGSLKPRYSKYGIKGGWKGGARFAFYTAVVVLVINIILLIVCTTALRWMDSMTMVYIGSCTKTERINAGLHFVVNFLSTCLLAASNYCMQLLSAPTREDVDSAHARGHWLDIGIPSMRNLRSLKKKKIVLWWILAVSSIPLHLLYNSVFFSAIATNDYHVLYVTPGFVTGDAYDRTQFPDTSNFSISHLQSRAPTLQRLDRQECIRTYGQDFLTDHKDVIAVVRNVPVSNSSLLRMAEEIVPPTGLTPQYNPFSWICDDPKTVNKTEACCSNAYGFVPCSKMIPELEAISEQWWRSGGFDIDYCLTESFPPDCHEHFAPPIMAPVLFFNAFKVAIMWYVAFKYSDKPLVTVGDAIESFIKNPDSTTKNMCLATHKQIEHNWSKGYIPQPIRYHPHRQFWFQAATRRQWLLLTGLFATAGIATSLGIGYGIASLNPSTIQQAWALGMGTVRQQNIISGLRIKTLGSNALFVSALIANSPQALFSFMYLIYSTVFNSMFLSREWDRFATHPKGRLLRVSEPVGDQKSTYILQIPYRYAIIMLVGSGFLHWLVSQSIFLANISIIPVSGIVPLKDEITSCAYSPKGMIFVLVLGLAMILWLVGNALRRYSGLMVLVGSNSAAISAACHVLGKTGGERDAMVLRPLRWGATEFSSRRSGTWGLEPEQKTAHVSEDEVRQQDDPEDEIGDKLPPIPLIAGVPMSKYNRHTRNTSSISDLPQSHSHSTSWMGRADTSYHGSGSDFMSTEGQATRSMENSDNSRGSNDRTSRTSKGIYFAPPPGSSAFSTPSLSSPPSSSTLVSSLTTAEHYAPSSISISTSASITSPRSRQDHHREPYIQVDGRGREIHAQHNHIRNDNTLEQGLSYNNRSHHDDEMFTGAAADQVGHCSFHDGPVGKPVTGRLYA